MYMGKESSSHPHTPIDAFTAPHFLKLSQGKQGMIKEGVGIGVFNKTIVLDKKALHETVSDIDSAEHEDGHWSALIGLENAGYGVTRTGMSVVPTDKYRAVTWFSIGSNVPRVERAWITLVAALGSGTGVNHDYAPKGRGGDEAQGNYAAHVISIEKYRGRVSPGAIIAEAKSVSHGYVKQFSDRGRILRLAAHKTAA